MDSVRIFLAHMTPEERAGLAELEHQLALSQERILALHRRWLRIVVEDAGLLDTEGRTQLAAQLRAAADSIERKGLLQ